MSTQLFGIENGITFDDYMQVLYGSSIPGDDTSTSSAPVGSCYFQTNGSTYKKYESGAGITKWKLEVGDSGYHLINNVTTKTPVDAMDVQEGVTFAWTVTCILVSDATVRESFILVASHNGTGDLIPTETKCTLYGRIRFGTIPGLLVASELSSDSKNLLLVAEATDYVNIQAQRLTQGFSHSIFSDANGMISPPPTFENLISTPDTLSGYGITNAYTKIEVDSAIALATPDFNSLVGKPTTLSGYGITNAYTKIEVDSLISGVTPTSSDVTSVNGLVGSVVTIITLYTQKLKLI